MSIKYFTCSLKKSKNENLHSHAIVMCIKSLTASLYRILEMLYLWNTHIFAVSVFPFRSNLFYVKSITTFHSPNVDDPIPITRYQKVNIDPIFGIVYRYHLLYSLFSKHFSVVYGPYFDPVWSPQLFEM